MLKIPSRSVKLRLASLDAFFLSELIVGVMGAKSLDKL
jgi:hypothetical protein